MEQIVVRWVKTVAWKRRLPQHHINATNATIIYYGSYGLGGDYYYFSQSIITYVMNVLTVDTFSTKSMSHSYI